MPPLSPSLLPPLPFLPPLKHWRYPWVSSRKAMTVCIAAVCQQSGEPRIVICADTRLESPGVGAADSMLKMLPLGYGWIALLATEDWNSASTLRDHLRGQWRRIRNLASPRRVSELTKTLSDQFAQTPFCTAQTEALICGLQNPLRLRLCQALRP
jgi:hypothetical protein